MSFGMSKSTAVKERLWNGTESKTWGKVRDRASAPLYDGIFTKTASLDLRNVDTVRSALFLRVRNSYE